MSAVAVPDAYYEPFDSLVTVSVSNTGETDISITGLMIEDISILNMDRLIAPGESTSIDARVRISDKMLDTGHFYVTVYYTYTDETGLIIPSINQIITSVRRLEDKIESEMRFALPDRPIDGEETVLVSYIMENIGETDMVNTVIICYPEGFFSAPMTVPVGGHTVIKRLVRVDELDKISARVSAQSAYSGMAYTMEKAYEGNLANLALTAEEYDRSVPSNPSNEQEETGDTTQVFSPTLNTPPEISVTAEQDSIIVHISAGSQTLRNVQISVNGKLVRTLVLLKAGLSTEIVYVPEPGNEAEYILSLSAVNEKGETVEAESESTFFVAPIEPADDNNETLNCRILNALVSAPRLTILIILTCTAALTAIFATAIYKYTKRPGRQAIKKAKKPSRKNV